MDGVDIPGHPAMNSELAQLLRSRGLHATAQRLAVLRALEACPHGTADELTQLVRDDLGTVSKQAVYDALALFCEQGLARRVQPAGSVVRFDPRATDVHHHVVCRTCGALADVEAELDTAAALAVATRLGFSVDEPELVLWGTYAACLARPPSDSRRSATPRAPSSRSNSPDSQHHE
jgi:Fur family transcriptional regulator, stress-responsive regulator